MAVQYSFTSHFWGLPSEAKRRKVRSGADAPGEGPQRRAQGEAETQPWLGAGKAAYRGRAWGEPWLWVHG